MLREGSEALAAVGIPNPGADAEVLLAHHLRVGRAYLHAHPEESVAPHVVGSYRDGIVRRVAREPLQHITGMQEFWSLPFIVSPAVLIPRPETELIVETCVARHAAGTSRIVDIGTGSGCVAVAVAHAIPGALLYATDSSDEALAVARLNASRNDVGGRIEFYQGDLFEPLRDRGLERGIDFVLSNPPYIAEVDIETLEPEVRDYEPRRALTPGPDPLLIHRRIAEAAPEFLKAGGFLIVEFGLGQGPGIRKLYSAARLEEVEIRPDLAGIDRVFVARAPERAR